MEYSNFVQWAFFGLLGYGFMKISSVLSDLTKSVERLNEKLAGLLEKSAWHERNINELHDRVRVIEKKDFKDV